MLLSKSQRLTMFAAQKMFELHLPMASKYSSITMHMQHKQKKTFSQGNFCCLRSFFIELAGGTPSYQVLIMKIIKNKWEQIVFFFRRINVKLCRIGCCCCHLIACSSWLCVNLDQCHPGRLMGVILPEICCKNSSQVSQSVQKWTLMHDLFSPEA